MSNIDERRFEKNGELTADYLLAATQERIRARAKEGNSAKQVAMVILYDNGEIECGCTSGSTLEKLGMLEYGKSFLIELLDDL